MFISAFFSIPLSRIVNNQEKHCPNLTIPAALSRQEVCYTHTHPYYMHVLSADSN